MGQVILSIVMVIFLVLVVITYLKDGLVFKPPGYPQMKHISGEIVSEEVLQHTAQIIGEHSAAAQALKNIEERRQNGKDPVCLKVGSEFIVTDRKNLIK